MAASKTYFVLTNFDLPPDGPIRLGSIIADPLEPEEILNPGDVVAISSHVHTSHKRDWDITESLQNGQVSVTARFLSSLRLDGTNGTGLDSEVTSRFSIQDVETLDFAPTQDYIHEAVNKESVRGYLEGSQYELPVFMITGLKIGRGLAQRPNQQTPQEHAPLGGTSDFVIGYRLVRITAGEIQDQGREKQEKSKVMGKMLGDDDERDTDFGSLRITLTAHIDGGWEVAAHEIVGSKSVTAFDEDGNTECKCVVVPPSQSIE
ncbi:hypothetical protein BKA61DRAFT_500388 [Leptodontidium sp. MPI-SDFR-AT-0119]|nr:hypothetical protein BKA61DRAFT_500388 [Leptodontidium sp. MPI-SDFR-AT-0119]